VESCEALSVCVKLDELSTIWIYEPPSPPRCGQAMKGEAIMNTHTTEVTIKIASQYSFTFLLIKVLVSIRFFKRKRRESFAANMLVQMRQSNAVPCWRALIATVINSTGGGEGIKYEFKESALARYMFVRPRCMAAVLPMRQRVLATRARKKEQRLVECRNLMSEKWMIVASRAMARKIEVDI
jgi:hypothetical protein